MPVSTAAIGTPADVHALADWMRTTLGARIGETAGDLHSAVNTAATGWLSPGDEAFRTRTTRSAQRTDELARTTTDAARAVDDLAVGLASTQAEMHEIRLAAAAEGLQVDGDDILEPGPAPVDPRPMTIGPATTQAEVDNHALAVEARNRWNRASAAYTRAADAADNVRRHWTEVTLTTFRNVGNDISTKWFLTAGDMVGAGARGLVASNAGALDKEASRLRGQAEDFRVRAANAPAGTPASTIYGDVDDWRRLGRRSGRSSRYRWSEPCWARSEVRPWDSSRPAPSSPSTSTVSATSARRGTRGSTPSPRPGRRSVNWDRRPGMRSSEQVRLPSGWRPTSRVPGILAVRSPVSVFLLLQAVLPALGTVDRALGAAGIAGSALLLVGAYGVVRSRWGRPRITAFEIDAKASGWVS